MASTTQTKICGRFLDGQCAHLTDCLHVHPPAEELAAVRAQRAEKKTLTVCLFHPTCKQGATCTRLHLPTGTLQAARAAAAAAPPAPAALSNSAAPAPAAAAAAPALAASAPSVTRAPSGLKTPARPTGPAPRPAAARAAPPRGQHAGSGRDRDARAGRAAPGAAEHAALRKAGQLRGKINALVRVTAGMQAGASALQAAHVSGPALDDLRSKAQMGDQMLGSIVSQLDVFLAATTEYLNAFGEAGASAMAGTDIIDLDNAEDGSDGAGAGAGGSDGAGAGSADGAGASAAGASAAAGTNITHLDDAKDDSDDDPHDAFCLHCAAILDSNN
jgi:hypothetical protein